MFVDLLALARESCFDALVKACGPKCDGKSSTVNRRFEYVSVHKPEPCCVKNDSYFLLCLLLLLNIGHFNLLHQRACFWFYKKFQCCSGNLFYFDYRRNFPMCDELSVSDGSYINQAYNSWLTTTNYNTVTQSRNHHTIISS